MSLDQEVSRGTRAKQLIEDELFKEAVEKTQQDVFDKFSMLDPTDKEGMVIQRLRLNVLASVVRNLQEVMETGALAEKQIEHEQTLAQRAIQRLKQGIRAF